MQEDSVLSDQAIFEIAYLNSTLELIDEYLQNLKVELTIPKYKLIMTDAMDRLNLFPVTSEEERLCFVNKFIQELETSLYLKMEELEFEETLFLVPTFCDYFIMN